MAGEYIYTLQNLTKQHGAKTLSYQSPQTKQPEIPLHNLQHTSID